MIGTIKVLLKDILIISMFYVYQLDLSLFIKIKTENNEITHKARGKFLYSAHGGELKNFLDMGGQALMGGLPLDWGTTP